MSKSNYSFIPLTLFIGESSFSIMAKKMGWMISGGYVYISKFERGWIINYEVRFSSSIRDFSYTLSDEGRFEISCPEKEGIFHMTPVEDLEKKRFISFLEKNGVSLKKSYDS